MNLQVLPRTDLKVSPLCLGTMTFGTPVTEADAIDLTHWALDHGVNFLDTANMYEGYSRYLGSPGGVAEEILGKALKGKREQAVVATKVGMKIGPTDGDQGLSRAHVLREIDRSLVRLGCDYVDLYYMHKADLSTPLAESIQAFNEIIEAGKARYWAISNFSAEQITNLLKICDENGWRRPVALQPAYSLLKRDIEAEILPLCQREQIAVLPYQVLQGGLLTNKYQRGAVVPSDSRQVEKPEWTMALTDELFDKLDNIQAEAEKQGRTLLQHALKSLLEQPAVVSLVIGVKRIPQLETLITAVE
ncbi:MAG: aldo/keto reductase [Chloroflexi bacterium]|nr:aldo/keto reductase [Chloroflexota bacterium]